MIKKKIEDIEESDFQYLIDNEIIEFKTLDYKKELNVDTDGEKKEFLADISSFTNANGGDLLIGIEQDNNTGKPISKDGITITNVDNKKQKLDNIIINGLEPQLPSYNYTIHPIELANSNYIIIIRIKKSWLAPHRIAFKKTHRFFSRTSSGKYIMDIQEIRSAFILSDTLTERIRKFREERISKIISGETPIPLINNAKVIFHLIPLNCFEPGKLCEIERITRRVSGFKPMFTSGWDGRYNLDGYLVYFLKQNEGKWSTYNQLFRNGIIEAAEDFLLNNRDYQIIPITSLEREIITNISSCIKVFQTIEVDPPIFAFLTITGVKGYYHTAKDISGTIYPVDRDILVLPEIVIEKIEVDSVEIGKIMRPCFDSIWNACGISKSPNYDTNDAYTF